MRIVLSERFKEPLYDKHRYLFLIGGRGSGKSFFAANKIFYRMQTESGNRFLVVRKVRATLTQSCIAIMLQTLDKNSVDYKWNKSDRILRMTNARGGVNEIVFEGCDDPEKLKSMAGITSAWVEEVTELSETDFTKLDLIVREPNPTGYIQIVCSANPDEAQGRWIKERFYDRIDPNALIHHSTIEDNPIAEVRKAYLQRLDELIGQDETYYKIYRLGEWALSKGIIFNWDTQAVPADLNPDAILYGMDFGYSIDPAVLVKIYRKADEFWIEELIYEKGLTNQALAARIKSDPRINVNEALIYADAAEPKSIEELCREGLVVKPALKGPDSVRAGIDYLKSRRIHITPESTNVIDERKTYKWREDGSGRTLPEPVAFNNHCLVAGTLIETKRGQVPIEFVTVADEVLTRQGWRAVLFSGITGESTEVITAYFDNGADITGTPDHRIWIEGVGFTPLYRIRRGDKVCMNQRSSTIGGLNLGDIRLAQDGRIGSISSRVMRAAKWAWTTCIGKYGKILLGQFPLIMKFTIRTKIRLITQSRILSVFRPMPTRNSMRPICQNGSGSGLQTGCKTSDGPPLGGINRRRVENGIGFRESALGKAWNFIQANANIVGRNIRLEVSTGESDFVLTPARLDIAGQSGSITNRDNASIADNRLNVASMQRPDSVPAYVRRIIIGNSRQPVYDLTIDGIPEFFANGILVHNSLDAARYAIYTDALEGMGDIDFIVL